MNSSATTGKVLNANPCTAAARLPREEKIGVDEAQQPRPDYGDQSHVIHPSRSSGRRRVFQAPDDFE